MTRTQEKRGIAMRYGDKEHALSEVDAARLLESRLRLVPANENGQGIDNSLLSYANKYGLEGDANAQMHQLAGEAIHRVQGVDGRFELISAEAILRMNKEYFGHLIDASYSDVTNAPSKIADGIEACSFRDSHVFTTTELFESGEYIVDDYEALIKHGLAVRMPGSMANGIDNSILIDVETLPSLRAEQQVSGTVVEQTQLDFGEAVEQLSFDFGDVLDK